MFSPPPISQLTPERDERENYTATMRERQERFAAMQDVECVRLNNLAADAQIEANRWGRIAARFIGQRTELLAEIDSKYRTVEYTPEMKALIRKEAERRSRSITAAVTQQRKAQAEANKYRELLKARES